MIERYSYTRTEHVRHDSLNCTVIQDCYEIIDSKRGHGRPLAFSYCFDDAQRTVEALNELDRIETDEAAR